MVSVTGPYTDNHHVPPLHNTHHHHQNDELDRRLGALPQITFWMVWLNLAEELVLRCLMTAHYCTTTTTTTHTHTHTHHHHQDEELDRRLGALPQVTFWMAWLNLADEPVLRCRHSLWLPGLAAVSETGQ